MRFAIVLNQMLGPHVNGSQVACWAVVRRLLAEGHEVYVCPLLDQNAAGELQAEIRMLEDTGARFHPILFDRRLLRNRSSAGRGPVSIARELLCLGGAKEWVPWLRLQPMAKERLAAVQPDAVLCYDFTALAATHGFGAAPRMAVVVDLWHLVVQERWQVKRESTPAWRRPLEALHHRRLARLHRTLMLELLAGCEEQIEFAPHHAEWLRRQGLPGVRYLQTPVEDPLPECADLRIERSRVPTILMIGDLTNVATRLGMELFAAEMLPELERRLGPAGFEVRVVGGGHLPPHVACQLDRPGVRLVGRVSPPHSEFLAADLVLVPTPVEIGMRVRIAVAFGYGCCVVAHRANQAGIPEMRHDSNALLGADGPSLAREVERGCADPALRKAIGQQARATFEEYFSARRAADRLTERLCQLAGAGKRSGSRAA